VRSHVSIGGYVRGKNIQVRGEKVNITGEESRVEVRS